MTPAQHARKLGVELKTVSESSGVPLRTLHRWRHSKPFVFAAVCEKVAWHKVIADAIADTIIEKRKESNDE